MKTLSLLLLLAVQGGIAQNKATTLPKRLPTHVEFCRQNSSEAIQYVEEHHLMGYGWLSRNPEADFGCLDHGKAYKWEIDSPKYKNPVAIAGDPEDILEPPSAQLHQPNSATSPPSSNICTGACMTTTLSPAPQPLVEKAFQTGSLVVVSNVSKNGCNEEGFKWGGNGACQKITPIYTCPKHDGYFVFLLPDESTGEKMCVMLPKEK